MTLRESDGARRYLEAAADHTPGSVFPDAARRVSLIEQHRPQVRFTRHHDGTPIGWGVCPEQATGTIEGQPFYFRFRHDTARLSVWPAEICGECINCEDLPTYTADPVLEATMAPVTGEPLTSGVDDEATVNLFCNLVDGLHPPKEPYSLRCARLCVEDGTPDAEHVWRRLHARIPSLTVLDRGPHWAQTGDLLTRTPHANTLHFTWGGPNPNDWMECRLYTPDARPIGRGDYALIGGATIHYNTTGGAADAAITALRGLNPEDAYHQFTSRLPPADRRHRQAAAVQAYREVANLASFPRLDRATEKAWTAMATEDFLDFLRRH